MKKTIYSVLIGSLAATLVACNSGGDNNSQQSASQSSSLQGTKIHDNNFYIIDKTPNREIAYVGVVVNDSHVTPGQPFDGVHNLFVNELNYDDGYFGIDIRAGRHGDSSNFDWLVEHGYSPDSTYRNNYNFALDTTVIITLKNGLQYNCNNVAIVGNIWFIMQNGNYFSPQSSSASSTKLQCGGLSANLGFVDNISYNVNITSITYAPSTAQPSTDITYPLITSVPPQIIANPGLTNGLTLQNNQGIITQNGDNYFLLVMQPDNNLVSYFCAHDATCRTGVARWATFTDGKGTPGQGTAVFQSDGNLVVYPDSSQTGGTALWNSGTNGHNGAYMELQKDGNLVIYPDSTATGGTALWNSNTQLFN